MKRITLSALLLLAISQLFAQTIDGWFPFEIAALDNIVLRKEISDEINSAISVTFQVDMQDKEVSADGVYIKGNWNDWNEAVQLQNTSGSIYSTTLEFESESRIDYKFFNGNPAGSWNTYESENFTGTCTDEWTNRIVEIAYTDTTLDVVCFNSCEACDSASELIEVTFRVDMQNETVSSSGVFLRGNFNGWNSNAALQNDGTIYYTTIELEPGTEVQYKFVNGDVWEEPTHGSCTKTTDATNRYFIVPDENINLDPVCFNSCSACNTSEEKVNVTFRVDMQNETVSPDGVFLGGDWNSWHTWVDEKVEMEANGSIYTATVELPVGLSMIYKFGNGDQWEDEIPGDCTVGDNNDRQLTVPENNTTLDLVCFNSCEVCENNALVEAPFSRGVGFSEAFESGSSVYDISFQYYTLQDFKNVKILGIDQVRLPIFLSNMLNENGNFEPLFFYLLDQYVDMAEAEGVNLILTNMQGYNYSDPGIEAEFINVWTQMAQHYKNRSELIHYELANEPSGIDDEDWGRIQGNIIAAIREIDTQHTILVTPAMWGDLSHLQYLPEYEDDNLIYVFHFYSPLLFTLQGGYGLSGMPFPYDATRMPAMPANFIGTENEWRYNVYPEEATPSAIREAIDITAQFKNERNVPLWCGEFGADDVVSVPEDRAYWYEVLRTSLEENGISWSMHGYKRYYGVLDEGTNKMFDHDLNIAVVEAMGLNVPEQSEYDPLPETGEQIIYQDYLSDDFFHNWYWPDGGETHFYCEEDTYIGEFCIVLKDRPLWSIFSMDYLPTKDFSQLEDEGYALSFWIKGDTPGGKLNIKFIDSKTDDPNDREWAVFRIIDESYASWDNQWHNVQIPLSQFIEDGIWEDGIYYEPTGSFDWSKVKRIQINDENQSLDGVGFWLDELKISKVDEPETVQVTFQVDMQNETVSSSGVFLRGSFNGWNSNAAIQNNGTLYYTTLELKPGTEVLYKFVNGDEWEELTPGSCTKTTDVTNRYFIVPDENTTLDPVCFNSCSICNASVESVSVTFRVDMQNETVSPDGVFLGGDWNSWYTWEDEKVQMEANGTVYTTTVEVPAYTTITYKFKNGESWEDVQGDCAVGENNNRQFISGESDMNLNVVCFNSCESCTSAVFEINGQEVSVYPNPVDQILYIDGLSNLDNYCCRLIDVLGRVVFELDLNHQPTIQINMEKLKTGQYFLQIQLETGLVSKPILKI